MSDIPILSPDSGGSLNTNIVSDAIRTTGNTVLRTWNSGRLRSSMLKYRLLNDCCSRVPDVE